MKVRSDGGCEGWCEGRGVKVRLLYTWLPMYITSRSVDFLVQVFTLFVVSECLVMLP